MHWAEVKSVHHLRGDFRSLCFIIITILCLLHINLLLGTKVKLWNAGQGQYYCMLCQRLSLYTSVDWLFLKTGFKIRWEGTWAAFSFRYVNQDHLKSSLQRRTLNLLGCPFNYSINSINWPWYIFSHVSLHYVCLRLFVRHLSWPPTWQTSVCGLCVWDNDNLTLKSTLRGASLMPKLTPGHPPSPCLRSLGGVWGSYCQHVCVWNRLCVSVRVNTSCRVTTWPFYHIFCVLLFSSLC